MLRIFASTLPRLSPDDQQAAVDDIARVISTATGQVLTMRLEQAVLMLRRSLHDAGFPDTAARLDEIETETASQRHEPAPAHKARVDQMPSSDR